MPPAKFIAHITSCHEGIRTNGKYSGVGIICYYNGAAFSDIHIPTVYR